MGLEILIGRVQSRDSASGSKCVGFREVHGISRLVVAVIRNEAIISFLLQRVLRVSVVEVVKSGHRGKNWQVEVGEFVGEFGALLRAEDNN